MFKHLFDCDTSKRADILELWIVDPDAENPARKILSKFNFSELELNDVLPDDTGAAGEEEEEVPVAEEASKSESSSSDSSPDVSADESAESDEPSQHADDDDFILKSANQRIDECPDEFISDSENRIFLFSPDRANHCLILKEATFLFQKAKND